MLLLLLLLSAGAGKRVLRDDHVQPGMYQKLCTANVASSSTWYVSYLEVVHIVSFHVRVDDRQLRQRREHALAQAFSDKDSRKRERGKESMGRVVVHRLHSSAAVRYERTLSKRGEHRTFVAKEYTTAAAADTTLRKHRASLCRAK